MADAESIDADDTAAAAAAAAAAIAYVEYLWLKLCFL